MFLYAESKDTSTKSKGTLLFASSLAIIKFSLIDFNKPICLALFNEGVVNTLSSKEKYCLILSIKILMSLLIAEM